MTVAFTPLSAQARPVFDHHRGQGDQRQLDVARDIGKTCMPLRLNLVAQLGLIG